MNYKLENRIKYIYKARIYDIASNGWLPGIKYSSKKSTARSNFTRLDDGNKLNEFIHSKPGMSGIEVCKAIRNLYGTHIPIVILSARNQDNTEEEGKRAGCNDFVPKPFSRVVIYQETLINLGCFTSDCIESLKGSCNMILYIYLIIIYCSVVVVSGSL